MLLRREPCVSAIYPRSLPCGPGVMHLVVDVVVDVDVMYPKAGLIKSGDVQC